MKDTFTVSGVVDRTDLSSVPVPVIRFKHPFVPPRIMRGSFCHDCPIRCKGLQFLTGKKGVPIPVELVDLGDNGYRRVRSPRIDGTLHNAYIFVPEGSPRVNIVKRANGDVNFGGNCAQLEPGTRVQLSKVAVTIFSDIGVRKQCANTEELEYTGVDDLEAEMA